MTKKKKGSFVLKVLGFLFIIYIALFIASMSGYYEGKIRDQVIITNEGIKAFEEKIKNGEEIDISSFLDKEKEDYSSNFSKLGDTITNSFENVITYSANIVKNIIKSLF